MRIQLARFSAVWNLKACSTSSRSCRAVPEWPDQNVFKKRHMLHHMLAATGDVRSSKSALLVSAFSNVSAKSALCRRMLQPLHTCPAVPMSAVPAAWPDFGLPNALPCHSVPLDQSVSALLCLCPGKTHMPSHLPTSQCLHLPCTMM